jgi:hypothetical protein
MSEIAGRRPALARLTRGNAGDFRPWGKYTHETELPDQKASRFRPGGMRISLRGVVECTRI